MFGRGVQSETTPGISLIPHLHSVGIDRCHVVDIILDQTRSHSSQNHTGSNFATDVRYE